MSETVLDVRHLQVQFATETKPVVAVDDLNFQLNQGEKLGIVGESGSGKSVTSLAIMGLVPTPGRITQGEILFAPRVAPRTKSEDRSAVDLLQVTEAERRSYRGGEIAMIFQEPMSALNPVYDIGFQLTEAILLHQKVSSTEANRKAIALLQEVQLLPSDQALQQQCIQEYPDYSEREVSNYINRHKQAILKRYPHELSGGQLQRVTIAMAISCNPSVLIADEPTTALDVTVQATILDLLRNLCEERGMALIFITHDLGVIAELVDSVAVMYRGKVVETGEIKSVFQHPQHPYTKGLLACRPSLDRRLQILPTVIDFMDVSTTPEGEIKITEKQTDLEQKLSQVVTEKEQQERLEQLLKQKPLMNVKQLRVGFPMKGMFGKTKKYTMAVNNVSFEVYPGETLGLVGESGCGKSTLARTLLRLIPAMSGDVVFDGDNITNLSLRSQKLRSLRRQMQIVFQNPYNSLNPRINIGKAIAEPLVVHKIKCDRKQKVAQLLERVGLNPNMINRYPHEFSGGQRQRVCIARALALEPQFIICDESVSALDVSVQAQVLNLLKELQEEMGLTYIFISHDLSVVKFMSDRIIVMNQGKIEEIGTSEEIYRNPQTDYTRKLINSIPLGEFA